MVDVVLLSAQPFSSGLRIKSAVTVKGAGNDAGLGFLAFLDVRADIKYSFVLDRVLGEARCGVISFEVVIEPVFGVVVSDENWHVHTCAADCVPA